jgi:hypothetical protein
MFQVCDKTLISSEDSFGSLFSCLKKVYSSSFTFIMSPSFFNNFLTVKLLINSKLQPFSINRLIISSGKSIYNFFKLSFNSYLSSPFENQSKLTCHTLFIKLCAFQFPSIKKYRTKFVKKEQKICAGIIFLWGLPLYLSKDRRGTLPIVKMITLIKKCKMVFL